jgi:hypothetical protein
VPPGVPVKLLSALVCATDTIPFRLFLFPCFFMITTVPDDCSQFFPISLPFKPADVCCRSYEQNAFWFMPQVPPRPLQVRHVPQLFLKNKRSNPRGDKYPYSLVLVTIRMKRKFC